MSLAVPHQLVQTRTADGHAIVVPTVDRATSQTRKLGDQPVTCIPTSCDAPDELHKINGHEGGGLLGSPALPSPTFGTEIANSVGTTLPDALGSRYLEVDSTPAEIAEALSFFVDAKAKETDGQRKRANSLHGSVFSIMQWRRNPRTGMVMLTQEQLDGGIAKLQEMELLDLHADIWQNKDTYNDKGAAARTEKGFGVVIPGDLVPLHNHMVLKLRQGCELTVRQVSDVFAIPSARIQLPREAMADAPQGRGAAMRAFLDLTAYLTHELVAGDHSA